MYRALDVRLHREVAIKVLPDNFGGGLERFQREARAASSRQLHICAVYDVGEADGRLFLVMELVEGPYMAQYARDRPLDAAEVIEIGFQVADALEAAHAKGIIHRDIKPGNIMISKRRHVKVLDFGLAKQVAPDGRRRRERGWSNAGRYDSWNA